MKLLYEELDDKSLLAKIPIQGAFFTNVLFSENIATIDWVLKNVINTKKIDLTPILHVAAAFGNVEMIEYGLNNYVINTKSITNGRNILQQAVANGKLKAVIYIVETLKLSKYVTSHEEGNLLHLAFQSGDMPTIKYVKEFGIDPKKTTTTTGWTILHNAAKSQSPEAIRDAVKLGIDPNIKDRQGNTALLIAVRTGSLGATKCAIEECKIDCINFEEVLRQAAYSGDLETFKYIVSLMKPEIVKKLINEVEEFNEGFSFIIQMILGGMGVQGIKFAIACEFNISVKSKVTGDSLLHFYSPV